MLTSEEEKCEKGGTRIHAHVRPVHVVQEKFLNPLRTVAKTSATALSEVMESLVNYGCHPVGDDSNATNSLFILSLTTDPDKLPSHVRKLINNEIIKSSVLNKVVDSVLHMYSICGGDDFVGFESGAGFVPGDPRDPVGVRLIRRLLAILTRLVVSMHGQTKAVLDAIVYLFMGGNGTSNAHVDDLVTPLIKNIFTESGSGNPKYKNVVDAIHSTGKGRITRNIAFKCR